MAETDASLLRRSRRDPDAFVEVCRRHSEALAGWLRATVHDDALASELLAETLSEAWFSCRRFRDPGDGDARGWLFGIARNLVRRVYRDRAIERRARLRLGLPVPEEDTAAAVVDRLAAEQQVAELGPIPEALELRVVDDLEYAEIADRLDLTPEGARTRVFRALGTLRTQIGRSAP
ncbi:MAG: RNA polymerase sigma factor [Pyrinomonadaceae bacterium]